MFRLNQKVALVSGAASGIGAAIAEAMAENGAKVVIADVLDKDGAALAAKIGPSARYVHLDVTRPADWANAVEVACRAFGRLNVLVNNMGSSTYGPIELYAESDWQKTISINLTGAFIGIKAAIPALKSAGGASIINICSPAGLLDYAAFPAYFAATFGLSSLTKAAALELARNGIRVNCIHPGLIGGRSTEIGHLAVFLASDESSFSTAQEFTLDDGQSASALGWSSGNRCAAV